MSPKKQGCAGIVVSSTFLLEPIDFQQNMLVEPSYHTTISGFVVFLTSEIGKNIQILCSKISQFFLESSKNVLHVEKTLAFNMCPKFQVLILKNGWALPFWVPQKDAFYAIYENYGIFSIFQFFFRFGSFKKCSTAIFRFWRKSDLKHVSNHPNSKLEIWPCLTLRPWTTVIWHQVLKC